VRLSLLALLVALLGGCTPTRSGGANGEGPASSAVPSASASAERTPPPATSLETWTGKYDSEPGSLYVYDGGEWAGVTWRGDEAGVALGDGTLTLTVNRKTGAVRGTADGAVGSVVLAGSFADDTVTATVARKDPADRGLTGTLVAKVSGGALAGSMRLSAPDARVLREAKFTLSSSKP
jgi:hypothetical protein